MHAVIDVSELVPPLWTHWGLSVPRGYGLDNIRVMAADPLDAHNLVAGYLTRYPEAARRYERGQTGELQYYDILKLAEAECGQSAHYYDDVATEAAAIMRRWYGLD
jgi:hypothetical protein